MSATNPYLVHLGSGVAALGERKADLLAGRYRKFRNMGRLGHEFHEEDLPPIMVNTDNE